MTSKFGECTCNSKPGVENMCPACRALMEDQRRFAQSDAGAKATAALDELYG